LWIALCMVNSNSSTMKTDWLQNSPCCPSYHPAEFFHLFVFIAPALPHVQIWSAFKKCTVLRIFTFLKIRMSGSTVLTELPPSKMLQQNVMINHRTCTRTKHSCTLSWRRVLFCSNTITFPMQHHYNRHCPLPYHHHHSRPCTLP